MQKKITFTILCLVCAAAPLAAQTAAPENMVQIPAGKFWMGRTYTIYTDSADLVPIDKLDDRPANNIYLDAFYLDKYEVTNADYTKFLQANSGTKPPWHWPQGNFPAGKEKLPVYNVNWFEATAFCKWAGKRLPSEAEWEKAVRGGRDRKPYAWVDNDRDPDERVPAAISRGKAMAVGSFPPNGYGLYDMIGNVMEWTNDWYDANYYPFMPKKNPQGPQTGRYKSVRGAGYADQGGHGMEKLVSYRNFSDPDTRMTTIGFRCAK